MLSVLTFLAAFASVASAANVVQLAIEKLQPSVDVSADLSRLTARSATIQGGLYNNVSAGMYTANITVGAPPQSITVQIDSSLVQTFVLANTADVCTNGTTAYKNDGPCNGGTCEYMHLYAYRSYSQT